MALLRTKLLAGSLFAGLLFGPQLPSPQEPHVPGGIVKFVPLKAAEVTVKTARLGLSTGAIGAVGLSSAVGNELGLAAKLPRYVEMPTSVSGFAQIGSTELSLVAGDTRATSGGFIQSNSAELPLIMGNITVMTGGYFKLEGAKLNAQTGDVVARGILNPTVEELVVLYRTVRRNRRLLT